MTPASSSRSVDLQRLLSTAQLPALPQSAIKLLELSQDDDNGPAEYAVPIECDPGLTGQVLKFVNSSYFGFAREISSIKLAITLVGIRTIKNFVLWSAVFSLTPNPKCGPFDLKRLWQDSLRRGLFSRAAGRVLGLKDAEDAFAIGLLQDMAIPLLAKELPADYTLLLQGREGGKHRLSDLEMERFGWTHAQAGAEIIRKWNLPADFAAAIEQHCQIQSLLDGKKSSFTMAAVQLSSLLPTTMDDHWGECSLFEEAYQKVRPTGSPDVATLLAEVDASFAEFAPVLRIGTPGKSLVDCYQESTAAAG